MSERYKGWIKLWRCILIDEMYENLTSKQRDVMGVIMLFAYHKPGLYKTKHFQYRLKRGQFLTTLKELKGNCGKDMTIQNVRTTLKNLVYPWEFIEIEITKFKDKKRHLITIKNYEYWQRRLSGNQEDVVKKEEKSTRGLTQESTRGLTQAPPSQLSLITTQSKGDKKKSTRGLTQESTRGLTHKEEAKTDTTKQQLLFIKSIKAQKNKIVDKLKKMYPNIKEKFIEKKWKEYMKKIHKYSKAKNPEEMLIKWFDKDYKQKETNEVYKQREDIAGYNPKRLIPIKDMVDTYKRHIGYLVDRIKK